MTNPPGGVPGKGFEASGDDLGPPGDPGVFDRFQRESQVRPELARVEAAPGAATPSMSRLAGLMMPLGEELGGVGKYVEGTLAKLGELASMRHAEIPPYKMQAMLDEKPTRASSFVPAHPSTAAVVKEISYHVSQRERMLKSAQA